MHSSSHDAPDQTTKPETVGAPSLDSLQEAARLRALERYAVLDTMPEAAYEDIVTLASHICQAPMAMVSFIDHDRQWFKAIQGLSHSQTPRDIAFCAHALSNPEQILIVPDATQDARFVDNPLVTGNPHLRFYAGAPLRTPDNHVLGTVCVLDYEPRQLSEAQIAALNALSRQVMRQLELRVKARQLEETQQQFRAFVDNAPMLAYIKSEAGRYEYVNQPFLDRFAFTEQDIIGKMDTDLWEADVIGRVRELEKQVLQSGQCLEILEKNIAPDGNEIFWRIYKFPLLWQEHRAIGSIIVDITQSKCYEQQLEEIRRQLETRNANLHELSTTDELTKAHNRRSFIDHLRIEWERSARQRMPLSLLMIDVDHFKNYNDSFGHIAGDEVLRQLAQLLCMTARTIDIVARYGGEEFAVILPDADRAGALKFAERFRAAIENANWPRRDLTVSIGVATRDQDTCDAQNLLDHADKALYRAKQNGRNRVEKAP